jgi:RHS repeat-associated protein
MDRAEPEAIEQNLRFQGQYLDRDTGLHYNTFRYYDPDVGRFISPDPIGLMGGMNLQAYGPNPVSWVDPLGWCAAKKNVTKGEGQKLLTHSRGVGGNGAASELGNLGSRSSKEVSEILKNAGFEGKSISKSGYQRFKHADGSEVWANWQTGRIVRNAAPKYGPNGARINKGQRLDSTGAEIPRNTPHDQIVETFMP